MVAGINGYVKEELGEDGIKEFQATLRQHMGKSNFYSSLSTDAFYFGLGPVLIGRSG